MTKKIPFDLERLQKGNCKLVTRGGKYPTEWYYFKTCKSGYPIDFIIDGEKHGASKNGQYYFKDIVTNLLDLFLEVEVEETTYYHNIYKEGISDVLYKSLDAAIRNSSSREDRKAVQKTTVIGDDITIEIVHKY